jgi:hypothetical protein
VSAKSPVVLPVLLDKKQDEDSLVSMLRRYGLQLAIQVTPPTNNMDGANGMCCTIACAAPWLVLLLALLELAGTGPCYLQHASTRM